MQTICYNSIMSWQHRQLMRPSATATPLAVAAPHLSASYSLHGQLTNEVQNGVSLVRFYDSLNRPTGYSLMHDAQCTMHNGGGANPSTLQPFNLSTVTYSYDTHGRFASVTALGGTRFVASANPSTTFTYAYDHRGRMVTKTLCAHNPLWTPCNLVLGGTKT